MFRITHQKGFHLELSSGICVSVQFGGGNYSDNYHAEIGFERSAAIPILTSSTAEVMMWDTHPDADGKRGRTVTQEWRQDAHGGVLGWANADTIADAIQWASNYRSDDTPELAPALGGAGVH